VAAILVAITHGIQPYGGHDMGWTSPLVLAGLGDGIALLLLFALVETKVAEPMFHLGLFRIRAFAAGNTASLLASVSRGGLQFMLIIWLQGIWLPLTAGFLVAGPLAGHLSDRFGARTFATGGLVLVACSFAGLLALPVDFPYTDRQL